MRRISSNLKSRLNKRYQTKGNNSNPKMEIHIGKGLGRSVFNTFTIREGGNNGFSDLAISKSSNRKVASKVYVSHVLNNKIRVLSKDLPYNDEIPWQEDFKIDEVVSDSAIEFNGTWERDKRSGRHNLITNKYPYIFYISNNNLYYQYWDGEKELLASNVSKISTVRGWVPAIASHKDDQGLIVAYIRNGQVYYRNYSLNIIGTYSWEVERLVESLPGNCVDIQLSRTNDFRVAFTVQTATNEIHYAVTKRNWAGMSIFPENIAVNIEPVKLDLINLREVISRNTENISSNISEVDVQLCPFDYEVMKVLDIKSSNRNRVEVTFNHDILNTNLKNIFKVSGYEINIAKAANKLIITPVTKFPLSFDLIYSDNIIYKINDHCNPKLTSLTNIPVTFENEIKTINIENISITPNINVEFLNLNFKETAINENISSGIGEVIVKLIDIDDIIA